MKHASGGDGGGWRRRLGLDWLSGDKLHFLLNRIGEHLWVKPLLVCIVSILAALLARMADGIGLQGFEEWVPQVSRDSIISLLKIMSQSMLVIATFAVASLVSAYASASRTATPRAFALVLADDHSQNALSTFIGAFIFSIVAFTALENGYYAKAGRFALFALTLLVFVTVVFTFVRWVDRIARLGRMGTTIDKVEAATATAMRLRRRAPTLGGLPATSDLSYSFAVEAPSVGYVQRIDVALLQQVAEQARVHLRVSSLPGAFAAPGHALLRVKGGPLTTEHVECLRAAFTIGDDRVFDEDPRFGLIVLAEIAGHALSPAVNDPGTAIDIVGTLVRLFAMWAEPVDDRTPTDCDRVEVPQISVADMFDDAFTAIARDGAGSVEVITRLLKALESLTHTRDLAMRDAAVAHARLALARAELVMQLPHDIQRLRELAAFAAAR